jgi:hypothetical protein
LKLSATVSLAPNPAADATNVDPETPEAGLTVSDGVTVKLVEALNELVWPSALTVWTPPVTVGTVRDWEQAPVLSVVH